MLIASHAFFATLPALFSAAGWQQPADSSFGTTDINAVMADGDLSYVAVGNEGKIGLSSNSGFTWSQVDSPFLGSNIFAAHYANNLFVAGGSTGKIATSTDGVSWTVGTAGFGASPVLGLSYIVNQGLWVAVGGSGKLATSSDAVSWVLRNSSFGVSFINDVYSSGNLTIAVGYDGKLATSTNGISWTQRTSSFVFDIIYDVSSSSGGSGYLAVGDLGKTAISSDGISWAQVFPDSSFGSSAIRTVSSNGEFLVAGGSLGKIATSSAGVSWIQRDSTFQNKTVKDIALLENSAVAVGDGGTIAYSV